MAKFETLRLGQNKSQTKALAKLKKVSENEFKRFANPEPSSPKVEPQQRAHSQPFIKNARAGNSDKYRSETRIYCCPSGRKAWVERTGGLGMNGLPAIALTYLKRRDRLKTCSGETGVPRKIGDVIDWVDLFVSPLHNFGYGRGANTDSSSHFS